MERAVRIGDSEADLDVEDILAIHRDIAVGPALEQIAGKLREQQGWIGGWSPPGAAFVPPPPEFVPESGRRPLRVHRPRRHLTGGPSGDRARAVRDDSPVWRRQRQSGTVPIHTLLRRRGVAPRDVPPVSLVLVTDKDAYIAGLHDFRRNDVDRWVARFAAAVEDSAEIARNYSRRAAELEEAGPSAPSRCDPTHRPGDPPPPAVVPDHHRRDRREADRPLTRRGDQRPRASRRKAGILTRHRNQRKGDSWEAKELFAIFEDFQPSLRAAARRRLDNNHKPSVYLLTLATLSK